MKFLFLTLFIFSLSLQAQTQNPRVKIETSMGDMTLILYADKSPNTVQNFLKYIDKDNKQFYNNTLFHRVIKDFMIQGGGFTLSADKKTMIKKSVDGGIQNEGNKSHLKNNRGTIAMARTSDPHSATSQFFINHKNNDFLNTKLKDNQLNAPPSKWGYTVFGKVTEGLTTLDKIANTPTKAGDAPITPVIIKSIRKL